MKKTLALLALILAIAATDARAFLPAWGSGASLEEIQQILRTMRAERNLVPRLPKKTGGAAEEVYKGVFASVDNGHIQALLKDMSGVTPVTVGGETFSITDRYSPASKANYRKYWTHYFKSLGMTVQELPYHNTHGNGETEGHDVEAVLPGQSPDSVVIIVHYDSIGPNGADNPAADDDMSGMSMLMETARILAAHKGKLQHTVRFVAADYEEWGGLEGARAYAKYIKSLSEQRGFKIVAAVDDEQSGWNEGSDHVFDVFSCGGATDSTAMGDMLVETASLYSDMTTTRGCMGENSDHYAMWEIGVPAVVFSEHDPFNNPHFDQEGGDTYDRIDQGYIFRIAQVGVTFAARVVGISN
ncbi:MAG: M28 family metallopeptidase [Elusimicrobiota bacterium]